MNFLLLWNTVKYLKVRQIYWRLYYIFPFKGWFFPKDHKNKIQIRPEIRPKSPYLAPIDSLISTTPLTFCFLNETRTIDQQEDWEGRGICSENISKLWLYNLHYHSFAREENISLSEKLIVLRRWILENPGPRSERGAMDGRSAWAPYPLSLRIVNWVKFLLMERQNITGEELCLLLNSLEEQCEALLCQREYHLLGNHLFENGKALVIAGLVLLSSRADYYLKKGLKILQEEIPEQILDDGLHFERSPLYHCLILEGMLDLYHFLSVAVEGETVDKGACFQQKNALKNMVEKHLCKMMEALEVVTHEDGGIGFFNDTTDGIASSPNQLLAYAKSLGINYSSTDVSYLPKGGFVKLKNNKFSVIGDVGPIGPDYIPGHAHAESLCFEASFLSQRLFVNSGISTYDKTQKRQDQRSTQAHNCVILAGALSKNTAQVWGGFRVGMRPTVICEGGHQSASEKLFTAVLKNVPDWPSDFCQTRQFDLQNDTFRVIDYFESKSLGGGQIKEAYYHLHPQWNVDNIRYIEGPKETWEAEVHIKSSQISHSVCLRFQAQGRLSIHESDYRYATGFNNEMRAKKIIVSTVGRILQLTASCVS